MPIAPALSQSVSFIDDPARYPRYGTHPNADRVQERLAALDGAEAALVTSSSMGATVCALMALLRPGDHLLASSWIYGGTRHFIEIDLPRAGVEVELIDPSETRGWRRHIKPNTRVVFLESPVNPTTRVLDPRAIAPLAQASGFAVVCDATFASPINFHPLSHGADVVIHSATKYLNGHHDVLSGVVCGSAPFIEECAQVMRRWGQAPDPFACWLLERGLKTLEVRVERQNATAMALADRLAQHPRVTAVHYPGLATHPDHAIARELLSGFGGMLGFEVLGGGAGAQRVLAALRLIARASSLGSVESLVSEPRINSHADLTPAQREALGAPDGFIRLSVGLESLDDLWRDLSSALDA
ncbi:MAG: aminotransferase class I/II-fold pyridoxal phosphate-dependent enzyme [Gemmatimonadaceae bacterium]|jgi:cystathionine beta-lyase/cystathionine gamma-synthase|nr:aminotransferase class I/II-fold pyridoxal phosphate-dependent enzyme [Gemmatimonadaceae bacterium]